MNMRRNLIVAIAYGWITCFILLIITSGIIAFSIRLLTVTTENVFYISIITGLIILFISGLIAGIKGKEKGLLLGVFVGLGFVGMTFFLQYVGLNEAFTIKQATYQLMYVIAAVIGSVLGVNLTNR